ncbi:hypothetical protein HYU13_03395 [Candidatus Woesearchaeota archaeon]|nr:hypothetical protein [Candidatus Woesearchaeota archaeon]
MKATAKDNGRSINLIHNFHLKALQNSGRNGNGRLEALARADNRWNDVPLDNPWKERSSNNFWHQNSLADRLADGYWKKFHGNGMWTHFASEKMPKKRGPLEKLCFLAFGASLTGALLMDQIRDSAEHAYKPVQARVIEKKYGVNVRGYLHIDPESWDEIAMACDLERGQISHELKSLRLEPKDSGGRSTFGGIISLIIGSNTGFSLKKSPWLFENSSWIDDQSQWPGDVYLRLVLELNRHQAWRVQERFPEFRARWEAFSMPLGNGKLYTQEGLSLSEQALFWRNNDGADALSKEEIRNCQLDGFIDKFARSDFITDVARFCARAKDLGYLEFYRVMASEHNPGTNGDLKPEKVYKNLMGKLDLAVEYGLIPPEYKDFLLTFEKVYRVFSLQSHPENLRLAKEEKMTAPKVFTDSYLATVAFLEKHPQSVFRPLLTKYWINKIPRHVVKHELGDAPLGDNVFRLPPPQGQERPIGEMTLEEALVGRMLRNVDPGLYNHKADNIWAIFSKRYIDLVKGDQPWSPLLMTNP